MIAFQDLVRGCLWEGLWMSRAEIKQVCLAYDIPQPAPKTGSGKKNRIVKIDLVHVVLDFFFPDCDDNDKTRMINALMGHHVCKIDVELLEHVAALDAENAEAFKKQKEDAQAALERIIKKRAIIEEQEQQFEKAIPEIVSSADPKKAIFEEKHEQD